MGQLSDRVLNDPELKMRSQARASVPIKEMLAIKTNESFTGLDTSLQGVKPPTMKRGNH